MELTLKRTAPTADGKGTHGELYIDDVFWAYTLEDIDRGLTQDMAPAAINKKKIGGQTAIPQGRYEVGMTFSARFQKLMPQVLDVKGFKGIRLHAGNTPEDTAGCVLVGFVKTENGIGDSRAAFHFLNQKIYEAAETQKVYLTIFKQN
jgi:Family of unknown function (DUF5675)